MAYTKLTLYHQVSLTEADELKKEKDTKEIFSLLLAKSNINIRTLYNQSLLHLVTSSNQSPLLDVVILLLKGANPFARDDAGKTPADYLFTKEGSLKEGMLHHNEILGKMIDFFILPENFDELLKKLLEDKKRIDQLQGNDEDVSDDVYIESLRNTLKPYLRDYPTITGINGNTMLHRCLTADNYQEQALALINKGGQIK